MIGKHRGLISRLKEKINHEIISFHCLIHQVVLCAQTLAREFNEVMELVVKIVNRILSKGLKHRQCRAFLDKFNSQYPDLLLHNNVRWLSKGRVLERFAACIEEIKIFLAEKDCVYQELSNPEWIQKLYFMVDITSHLNILN